MQWAARSIPAHRSLPARRASISFEPMLSMEAASRRSSSSGKSPAKPPNPVAPVDSTAARSRSTIDSAVASETPAPWYVFALPLKGTSLKREPATSRRPPQLGPVGAEGREASDRAGRHGGRGEHVLPHRNLERRPPVRAQERDRSDAVSSDAFYAEEGQIAPRPARRLVDREVEDRPRCGG